ncbi:cytochrome c oxidase subunit 3 [Ferruginibacter albus]|uniref:cytochrome c oxidase subunit 3 n=1 Tax=Ferruginibacter albus TaxID=2875540 RepID=UPI001CC5DBB1|nr:heme-copper oxidase subunit III [Ferruginibacter albus]
MEQRKRIHPHKFTLWVGIASIIMMFAGFTSAYIVKRNQPNWVSFDLPKVFWYSTAVMVLSSVTIWQALKAFKQRAMLNYRRLVMVTFFLGVLFVVLQIIGFNELYQKGITLQGNVSFSFLFIIVGLHALHVLGGIIVLLILFLKAFSSSVRNYNTVPIELASTYWHFVDFLWVYLLIFLILIR